MVIMSRSVWSFRCSARGSSSPAKCSVIDSAMSLTLSLHNFLQRITLLLRAGYSYIRLPWEEPCQLCQYCDFDYTSFSTSTSQVRSQKGGQSSQLSLAYLRRSDCRRRVWRKNWYREEPERLSPSVDKCSSSTILLEQWALSSRPTLSVTTLVLEVLLGKVTF